MASNLKLENKVDAAMRILSILGTVGGTTLQEETRENAVKLINDYIKGDKDE